MFAIGPNGKRASLWVDAEGKLITTAVPGDTSALPAGARIAQALRVNAQGALMASGDGLERHAAGEVIVSELQMPASAGAPVIDKAKGTPTLFNAGDAQAGYIHFDGLTSNLRIARPPALSFPVGCGVHLEFEFTYLGRLGTYPTLFASALPGTYPGHPHSMAVFMHHEGLGIINTIGLYRSGAVQVQAASDTLVAGNDYHVIIGRPPGGRWFIECNGVRTVSANAPDSGQLVLGGTSPAAGFQIGDYAPQPQSLAYMNLHKFLFKVFK